MLLSPSWDFNFQLKLANSSLAFCSIAFLVTVFICYPYAHLFSIGQQIVGHISMIFLSGFIKVSYVLRCVAQQGLGLQVR